MAAVLRVVEGTSMDKSKALDAALSQIERQFGKGSIMRLGKTPKTMDVEVISSGSLSLDIALGIGGLPRGRVIEIYGPESSGKTTLALHCVAEAQKKGGICAFIDAEHALDPVYARKLGVNVDDLLISQPDAGEQEPRAGRQIEINLPREPFPSFHNGRLEIIDRLLDTNPFVTFSEKVEGVLTRISTEALLNVTAGGGSTVPTFLIEPR